MYDMHEMTAAHTTLPLPTWVEVTNLSNGKRIIVKVNDRGPFVAKRLIDLSHAAASALDIVRSRDGARRGPRARRAAAGDDGGTSAAIEVSVDFGGFGGSSPTAPAKPAELVAAQAASPKPIRLGLVRAQHVDAVRPPPTAQPERLFAQAGKFTKRADAVELVDTPEGARLRERVRRHRRRPPQIVASGARRAAARCGGGRTASAIGCAGSAPSVRSSVVMRLGLASSCRRGGADVLRFFPRIAS